MKRALPAALCLAFVLIPIYPSFITLEHVTVPGVSLLPHALTVTLLAVTAAIGVYFALVLSRVPPERPWERSPLTIPMVAWLLAAVLAALLGFYPAGGALFIGITAGGILWHCMVVRFYARPGVARAIYAGFLSSGLAASFAACAMVVLRRPAAQYAIGHGRAIGTFILPGELAGYLIVFLPIAFAVFRLTRRRWMRVLAASALAVGVAALVLTFSRAGWMGFAAAVAFYAFFSGSVNRRFAPLIVLGGLAAVLVVFNVHHDPAENYTRLSIWQAGVDIARRFPLTGVGPFDFARIYPMVRLPDGDAQAFHAHNFLLTILAETGIVGAAATIWIWWRFASVLYGRLRSAPRGGMLLAIAIAAGLAGTWVQGLIDTVSVVIFGLWMPALGLALAASAGAPADEL